MSYPLLIIVQVFFCGLIILGARASESIYCKYDIYPPETVHTALHMGKTIAVWSCNMSATLSLSGDKTTLDTQGNGVDLCAAQCTTYCRSPAVIGGPDPHDCYTLARYYSDVGRFTIPPGKYNVWTYGTCKVTQYNRLRGHGQIVTYCYDEHHWAGVVDYIVYSCGGVHGTSEGSCRFYNSLRFSDIEVEVV